MYPAEFLRSMTVCRYLVYGVLVTALILQHGPVVWQIYVVSSIPVVMHLFLRLTWSAQRLKYLHTLESAIVLSLMISMTSLTGFLSLSWIYVACSMALWGTRAAFAQAGVSVALGFIGFHHGVLTADTEPIPDGLFALNTVMFSLMLSTLAHREATRLVSVRRNLKQDQKLLLGLLPPDINNDVSKFGEPGRVRRVWMTVVFIDLSGFTRATRDLPGEGLQVLMNEFFSLTHTIVQRWGGIVVKFLGDGALCVFPEGEDNRRNMARQGVNCMMLLPGQIDTLNQQLDAQGYAQHLSIRIGMSSGYCAAGAWGTADRREYTVIGNAVNMAARLQSEADQYGGMLMDPVTAQLIEKLWPLQSPVEVELKGLGSTQAFPVTKN